MIRFNWIKDDEAEVYCHVNGKDKPDEIVGTIYCDKGGCYFHPECDEHIAFETSFMRLVTEEMEKREKA